MTTATKTLLCTGVSLVNQRIVGAAIFLLASGAYHGCVGHELRCIRAGAKPRTVIRRVSYKLAPNEDIVKFATTAGRMLAIPFVGYAK